MLMTENQHATLQRALIKGVLGMLVDNITPDTSVLRDMFGLLATGVMPPAETASLLTALRLRGENADIIYAAADAMRTHMLPLPAPTHAVDCCGTGGDGKGMLNISTAAAIVAAASGVVVVKHGNRSVSSLCGSADVLEELGVRTDMTPDEAAICLKECGITFAAAPRFHPAMRHAAAVRRALGFRTVFNIIGPLLNPARVKRQLLGVYNEALLDMMPQVMQRFGTTHALVVHGFDGSDELSATHPSHVAELLPTGVVKKYILNPADVGLTLASAADLQGGNAFANAQAMQLLFEGERNGFRQAVLFNAGALIYVAGRAQSIAEGVTQAAAALDTGAALQKLSAFIDYSHTYLVDDEL